MKSLLFLTLVAFAANGQGERINEYKASNGITYHEGDNIKLGLGSGVNGSFVFLKMGGIMAGSGTPIGSAYAGLAVTVKKIKQFNSRGVTKIIFTVGGGNITNYTLEIEEAIRTCEIFDCPKNQSATAAKPDKLDQLKKLKELLDSGAITQEEYDKEKKKILDEN